MEVCLKFTLATKPFKEQIVLKKYFVESNTSQFVNEEDEDKKYMNIRLRSGIRKKKLKMITINYKSGISDNDEDSKE